MKYKARLDLDLSSDDVLEAELREAVHAYAKSVAREEIEREIKEEIISGVYARVDRMFTNRWGQTDIERLIRDTVAGIVKERMSQKDTIDVVQKCVSEAVESYKNSFKEYVASEFNAQLQSGYITGLIKDEIHKEIPIEEDVCDSNT